MTNHPTTPPLSAEDYIPESVLAESMPMSSSTERYFYWKWSDKSRQDYSDALIDQQKAEISRLLAENERLKQQLTAGFSQEFLLELRSVMAERNCGTTCVLKRIKESNIR